MRRWSFPILDGAASIFSPTFIRSKNLLPFRDAVKPAKAATAADASSHPLGESSGLRDISKWSPATWVSIALVFCFIAVRLWRLTAIALDGDEIFSLLLARQGWHDLMVGAMYDATHPPLVYVLVKIWRGMGGESLFWLRFFPFTACTLCLFPFFSLCRTLNIRPLARNLALGIACIHPYAIFYAQHLRMYCLLMLGGLLSASSFARYLEQPSRRRLVILTTVNLVLVYVHYFGWLIVGLEFLFLIWRRQPWRGFTVSMVLTGALFSPWGIVAGKLLYGGALHEKLGWISRPTVADFFWFYVDLTGCIVLPRFRLPMALVILAVLVALLWVYGRRQGQGIQWLAVLAFAPPLITVTASPWLPLWGERHLVFTVWPFLIILADSLCRLPKAAVAGALLLVACWVPFALRYDRDDNHKLPWDILIVSLMDHENSSQPHIPLYSLDRDTHFSLWFYAESLKTGQVGPLRAHMGARTDFPELAAKAARFEISKATRMDEIKGEYFWVAYSDPFWKEGLTLQEVLTGRHCQRGDSVSARDEFHSVTLVQVDCA